MKVKFTPSHGTCAKCDFSGSFKLSIGSESKCRLRLQAKPAPNQYMCTEMMMPQQLGVWLYCKVVLDISVLKSNRSNQKLPDAVKMTDIKIKFPQYLNASKLKRDEKEREEEEEKERILRRDSSQDCRILINCN